MSEKSFIDKMFDAADAALTPMEKVLSKDTAPEKHDDIIDIPDTDTRHGDWEKTFEVVHWAVCNCLDAGVAWHALKSGSMDTFCGKTITCTTTNRQVLEHGKTIPACTSCIIGVSK